MAWLHDSPISAAAENFNLRWDEVGGIMRRAMKRGLERRQERKSKNIGIDGTSARRRYDYVTVTVDKALHLSHQEDGDTFVLKFEGVPRHLIIDGHSDLALFQFFFSTKQVRSIPTPKLRHIFAVAGTLLVPLSQPQKRRKQPKHYAPLFEIIEKTLD
jgi:hypothetical protein